MMRPVALSDEYLTDFDKEEMDEFEARNSMHGRRRNKGANSILDLLCDDEFEDEDDGIADLVDQLDAGIVDYE